MVEIMRFLGVSDAREYRAVRWGGAALFAGGAWERRSSLTPRRRLHCPREADLTHPLPA